MSIRKTTSQDETGTLADVAPPATLQLSGVTFALRYCATLVLTVFATVIAVGIDSRIAIPNLSLTFVVPVVIAAVAFGLGASLFSAVLGTLAYNFFLTAPRYTFRIDDPANIWAIVLLFAVGCIASAVASLARRRADEVELLTRQAAVLRSYSRDLVTADTTRVIAARAVSALESAFGVPAAVIILSDAGIDRVEQHCRFAPLDIEFEAARSSAATGAFVPARSYPFDDSRFDFWPVAASKRRQVVIGVAFTPDERPARPETIVEIVGNALVLALDRARPRH